MLPLRWSAKALDELDAIAAYIALFNPAAAEELQALIEASVLPLSEHPYLYRAGRVAGPCRRRAPLIARGAVPDSAVLHPGYRPQHRANAKAMAQAAMLRCARSVIGGPVLRADRGVVGGQILRAAPSG